MPFSQSENRDVTLAVRARSNCENPIAVIRVSKFSQRLKEQTTSDRDRSLSYFDSSLLIWLRAIIGAAKVSARFNAVHMNCLVKELHSGLKFSLQSKLTLQDVQQPITR